MTQPPAYSVGQQQQQASASSASQPSQEQQQSYANLYESVLVKYQLLRDSSDWQPQEVLHESASSEPLESPANAVATPSEEQQDDPLPTLLTSRGPRRFLSEVEQIDEFFDLTRSPAVCGSGLLGDCFEHWRGDFTSPDQRIAPVDAGRARVRSPASDARAGPDPFGEAVARFAKPQELRLAQDSFGATPAAPDAESFS